MKIVTILFVLRILGPHVDTDRAGVLVCTDADMLRDLAYFSSIRDPASIEYEESSLHITSVSPAPTDFLVYLSHAEDDKHRVEMTLLKRPTMLYLSRSHVRFKQLYALLQRALKEKKIVTVGTLPGGMEVQDVRIIGDE